MASSELNLNIIIHQDKANNAPYYAAEAVQLILLKYFTLQIIAAKKHIPELSDTENIKHTTQWLASKSHKQIIFVNHHIWEQIRTDFVAGRDLFFINGDINELALVFWPNTNDTFPSYLQQCLGKCEEQIS